MIGASGGVRGKKVSSLARWPPVHARARGLGGHQGASRSIVTYWYPLRMMLVDDTVDFGKIAAGIPC
jgi:hypothetical protein